ncbi:hypothetical protein [Helicobacter anatolicus]|uniref:hypothetical protein n=1 Tax=Helicobacter anatolicus TaxID=2905874 RepID=UPI001E5D75AA|nr:hypothetical protein [Helicobacter anatolicus]MCE3038474.1 hypothetical protein [Helicobacter anatolicus]
MIYEFKFTILYIDGFDILKNILYFHVKQADLLHAEKLEENASDYAFYSFYIQASKKEMIDFAEKISQSIPLSINFSFEELKELEEIEGVEFKKNIDNFYEENIFDAKLIKETGNINSLKIVFDWLTHLKYQNQEIDTFEAFQEVLHDCVKKLLTEELVLETTRGKKILSLNASQEKNAELIFWDIENLKTYMSTEALQVQSLASYEKPIIALNPKDIFRENLGDRIFWCMLPYDLFLSALGGMLLQQGIHYAYILSSDKEAVLSYHQKKGVSPAQNIVVSQSGIILDTQKVQGNPFSIIKAHQKELRKSFSNKKIQNQKHLIVCLSKKNPTLFWIGENGEYQSALNFSFELNPKLVLQDILAYKDGEKLLKNFYQVFKDTKDRIEIFNEEYKKTSNIFQFLSVVAFIAQYDKEFNIDSESILNHARKYVRDRGPRIDYKIVKDEQQNLKLDYPKILRSVMSFLLAGVDEATLSYGILDSMGEFFGNFIQDLCVNFSLQNVLIFGSLLEEKIFLDKILHYIPKNIYLVLPKKGYLDYYN